MAVLYIKMRRVTSDKQVIENHSAAPNVRELGVVVLVLENLGADVRQGAARGGGEVRDLA